MRAGQLAGHEPDSAIRAQGVRGQGKRRPGRGQEAVACGVADVVDFGLCEGADALCGGEEGECAVEIGLLLGFWGGEEVAQGDAVEVAAGVFGFAVCAAKGFGGWGVIE